MADKNPKHPLKKKKVGSKGDVVSQKATNSSDLDSKSAKHIH